MHYLKKLKIILQYNYIYYFLLILSILYVILMININHKSIYSESTKEVSGIITDYKVIDDKITIYLKAKENILINYYFKDKKEINDLSYGDYIKVYGSFKIPNNNTNFNLFNYKKYLFSKNIKYMVTAKKIKFIKKTDNIFYKMKNKILKRINSCPKTGNYIKTFIFADKNDIDNTTYSNYQKLGISHLLSISGLHISFISLLLLKIFSKLSEIKRYLIVSIILFIYLFFTNFTISMFRAYIQFILFFINKLFKLNVKNENVVVLILSIFLFINPFNIYNIGFLFSFSICYGLIRFNNLINKGNIIFKLFKISLISFLISIPILIYNFFKINLLSIFVNILFVPFISYIIFPFSLITLIFPFFDNLNYIFINIFEKMSLLLSNINIFTINISKIPILLIFIYYIFLYKLLLHLNKKNCIKLIFTLIIFILYKKIVINSYITFIDVGQGDSTLIRTFNKNILIDTGGNINYKLSDNILIPFFKSEGVNKISYLILTHGDFDHMGEAINLVNNFKVEKVIFNCGEYNDLEKELIKVLDKKKIKYYSCIKELKINNNKLYFLQTSVYDNENDNSNVIYTELNGYKFMFMGDAGVDKEKDILDKYNISNIDVLKVGHHGSKTSSGKEFIDEINPKYSIISVGKNNRYGHPNKEVLNNLDNSKIYRTDKQGSIMFKIKSNKLKIDTCSP